MRDYKKYIALLFTCGLVLMVLAGVPQAGEKSDVRMSSTGTPDIFISNAPCEVNKLVNSWQPHIILDEIRFSHQVDSVRGILSRYLDTISSIDINWLAKILVQEAASSGLDPVFLAALIRVESTFSTHAVSRMGARGLMQVMPETAKEIAHDLGMEWKGLEQLHDPEINIRLGSAYFSRLLARYRGSYEFALTAYNRGPQVVQNIVKQDGMLKSEHTCYYQKVQRLYQNYLCSSTTRTSVLRNLV